MNPEQREALQWAVKVLDEVMEGDEPQATIRAMLTAPAAAPSSPGQDVEELIDAIVAVPDASKWGPTKGDFKNYKAALEAWWRIYGDLTVRQALAAPAPAPRQVTHICEACDMEWHTGKAVAEGHTCDKAPAPACKTCGGFGEVEKWDSPPPDGFYTMVPCPDCNDVEGEL